MLESRATKIRVLAIAEAGDTVTADHLLQMACLAAEHKPTVLGIPGQVPIPYQLECTVVLLQSSACPLPAADLWQYNAALSPSGQLCCWRWALPPGKIMGT